MTELVDKMAFQARQGSALLLVGAVRFTAISLAAFM